MPRALLYALLIIGHQGVGNVWNLQIKKKEYLGQGWLNLALDRQSHSLQLYIHRQETVTP